MRSALFLSIPALLALGALGAAGCESTASPTAGAAEPTAAAQQADQALPATQCIVLEHGAGAVVADAQIMSGAGATKNFGASGTMNTGQFNGDMRQTLIKVDPGSLPPMLQLVSASLRLPVRQAPGAATISAYQVLVPWDEATVTWNSFYGAASPIETTALGTAQVAPGDPVVYLDVTDFAWAVANGVTNDGVLLTQDDGAPTNFWSSDNIDATTLPQLEVCYVPDLCADVTCAAADTCHTAGACDPSTGRCSNPAKPDGTPCSDGNDKTTNDVCAGGTCAGSAANGGYVYPLFGGGPGFACPTGTKVWVSATPRDPGSSDQAQAACEACYGAGHCYLSDEDGAGVAWGPNTPNHPSCGQAYFGFAVGSTGDDGRAWPICDSSKTLGYWGK